MVIEGDKQTGDYRGFMKIRHIILSATLALTLFTVSGCAKDYSFSRAVYDGIQTSEQMKSSPAERNSKSEAPSYQQYESERKRQK